VPERGGAEIADAAPPLIPLPGPSPRKRGEGAASMASLLSPFTGRGCRQAGEGRRRRIGPWRAALAALPVGGDDSASPPARNLRPLVRDARLGAAAAPARPAGEDAGRRFRAADRADGGGQDA